MTLISLSIGLTWIFGAVLAMLDGRRRGVALLALAALGAGFVSVALLAIRVFTEGTVVFVAGDWPLGLGIALRADALGVTFAAVSSGVVFVALLYEVILGVRSRTFPALILVPEYGARGNLPDRGHVQLLRLFRDRDDGGLRPDRLPGAGLPGAGGVYLRRHKPLGVGYLPDRGGRPVPYYRHAGHEDGRRAGAGDRRKPDAHHRNGYFRGFRVEDRAVPVPLLAAGRVRGEPRAGRGHFERRPGEHRQLRNTTLRRLHTPRPARVRDAGAAGARDGEHYLRGTPGGRPALAGRGDGIFGYRTGGIHPHSYSYRWAGRVCGGGYLRGGQLAQQAAGLSGDRAAGLDGRGGVRRRGFQHRGCAARGRVS